MPLPLDLERLAVRIERLQRTPTSDWHPGDELEFKRYLPGSRGPQVLPGPEWLRDLAKRYPEEQDTVNPQWRNWMSWVLRAEGLIRDNDPRNPKRMMRDMARGRFPWR